MGYRGYDYFILEDKTLVVKDSWDGIYPDDAVWKAHCDVTNGFEEEGYTLSFEPKTIEVGFIDVWHEDHYGNKYATKKLQFEPDNSPGNNLWKKLKR